MFIILSYLRSGPSLGNGLSSPVYFTAVAARPFANEVPGGEGGAWELSAWFLGHPRARNSDNRR